MNIAEIILYTESQGNPLLRDEISNLYTESIARENILVSAGAEECIFLFFQAMFQVTVRQRSASLTLAEKGDSVVVHYPCYQSLREVAASRGEIPPSLSFAWSNYLREKYRV